MSEFTNTKQKRLTKLKALAHLILHTGNARSFIEANTDFIPTIVPTDFIELFDVVIKEGHEMEDVKVLTNKILNIFYESIREYNQIEPEPNSFLGVLKQNNQEMELLLHKIRPIFKTFVKHTDDETIKNKLREAFRELEVFVNHYTIKENVLFPVIEKTWEDYRCIQIMWSFHDDIRRDLKTVFDQLAAEELQFKQFNRCVGNIFFNMSAIKFREEKILFPYILEKISGHQLETMNREGAELGFPYVQPKVSNSKKSESGIEGNVVNLGTGSVSVAQLKLIFNHLPVDITFVDENNKVCFFSTPPERIFPRTTAIIGREVRNCHPPESVHVVEQIVESFRTGEKDQADFWIKMRGKYVLIQYFAVRDEQKNYKGVLEVSQEISKIKALEGEKRLLDW